LFRLQYNTSLIADDIIIPTIFPLEMKPLKLVIIISGVDKALSFEWMANGLDKKKFAVQFVLLNNASSALEDYLKQNFPVKRIPCSTKPQLITAFFKLWRFFFSNRPDIVHCHLFEASIVGLTASRFAGVRKRIYTRHHSVLQHTYYPWGVKYDKWCNAMATHIVAISETVKSTLTQLENVAENKITVIHHGFKLSEFENISSERTAMLREKYHIPAPNPVIGVISRYLHLKGITYIIEAFKKLLSDYPNAFLILANATGDYAPVIKKKLMDLPPDNFTEIVFEEDLPALYSTFSLFVHVPVDAHSEAFGQTYVEALAAGIPSVFTLSGIANEFIVDGNNALVVDYINSEQIYLAMKKLFIDTTLRTQLCRNGKMSVKKFSLEISRHKLETLYLK